MLIRGITAPFCNFEIFVGRLMLARKLTEPEAPQRRGRSIWRQEGYEHPGLSDSSGLFRQFHLPVIVMAFNGT